MLSGCIPLFCRQGIVKYSTSIYRKPHSPPVDLFVACIDLILYIVKLVIDGFNLGLYFLLFLLFYSPGFKAVLPGFFFLYFHLLLVGIVLLKGKIQASNGYQYRNDTNDSGRGFPTVFSHR